MVQKVFCLARRNTKRCGNLILILPNFNKLPSLVPNFHMYCLGWVSRDYRGHLAIYHTGSVVHLRNTYMLGGIQGQTSRTIMIPSLNLGVVLLTNQDIGQILEVVVYQVLDHFIDGKSLDDLKAATDTSMSHISFIYIQNG